MNPTLDARSVTVELPAEALRRLEADAIRRGVRIDDVIAELAGTLPATAIGPRHTPAFVGVGASVNGITDRIDQHLAEGLGRD